MNIGISTRCFGSDTLTVDRLEKLRRADFTRIEIYSNPPNFDFHNRSLVRSVARWFQENAFAAPSIHLPFEVPVVHTERRIREQAMDELKRSLELTEFTPVDYVVLHLGNARDRFTAARFDFAYAAIYAVRAFAGVRVLLENLP